MEFNLLSTSTTDTNTYFVITKIVGGVPSDYKIPVSDLAAYLGNSPIVANGDFAAQTGNTTICSYVPAADGTFQISGYLCVNNIATDILRMKVSFTDINSVFHQLQIAFNAISAPDSATTSVIFYPLISSNIRVKAGTTITCFSLLTTTGGTILYDCGMTITQIQ